MFQQPLNHNHLSEKNRKKIPTLDSQKVEMKLKNKKGNLS